MNINISRQTIYILVLTMFLFIFVLFFSFMVLIPEGQLYREQKNALKKENLELQRYQEFNAQTLERLKKLQNDNAHIITAYKTPFNASQFEKVNKTYFKSLSVTPKITLEDEEEFSVYEVNATSKINSPIIFYNFLEAINKSDWIIGVNFPIHFKREADMIRSSFTMRVYSQKSEIVANENRADAHEPTTHETKSATHH
ncbi:MAG: hypothetical protein WC656_03730 [Sulfurimonas sp.]